MLSKRICKKCWQSVNSNFWVSDQHEGWGCALWVMKFEYDPINLSTNSKPPKDCPFTVEHLVETQKCSGSISVK